MTDSSSDNKRHRSPAYPALSLPESVQKLESFYEEQKRNAVPVDIAMTSIGCPANSSRGGRAVAALISFGLLEEASTGLIREVKITASGYRISLTPQDDPERLSLIQDAAVRPKIYADMLLQWPEGLPTDPVISKYLKLEKDFNPAVVDGLIRNFRESCEYAQLGGFGPSGDTEDSYVTVTNEVHAEPVAAQQTARPEPAQQTAAEVNLQLPPDTMSFTLPLPGGKMAVLQVPTNIGSDDFAFLVEYLGLMKKAFVGDPSDVAHREPFANAI